MNIQKLRKDCFGVNNFSNETLEWIVKENYWNIWVPKEYGGLELTFSAGLEKLKFLAKMDGSLGWTITLCSGANYFIGNLKPEVAKEIFKYAKVAPCFGGSGGLSGTAEMHGDSYLISGSWKYATGAPYLSHFTLNAQIIENGKALLDEDGERVFRSFVVPRKDVEVIQDWNSMGLKATATHSFQITNLLVHKKYSFIYDEFYLPQPIYKIPFSTFADLTLWVNYVGMALHFLEEARGVLAQERLQVLEEKLSESENRLVQYATEIEEKVRQNIFFTAAYIQDIHRMAAQDIREISVGLVQLYPLLGVKASREDQSLNQVFRDYFTATQHHNFVVK